MRIKVDNIDVTLPEDLKILLVVGPNNAGKTRFLEAIASTNVNNHVDFEGQVEVTIGNETYRKGDKSKAYIVYGIDLDWFESIIKQDDLRTATELIRKYISDDIVNVYKADDGIHVVLKDFADDVPLNRLGRGYMSIIYLMALYAHFSPPDQSRFLFLLDSIEQYPLDAILIDKFTKFLVNSNAITIATTTNAYMYNRIMIHGVSDIWDNTVMVMLLNRGKYELLTVEEALDIGDYEDLTLFARRLEIEEKEERT